MEPQVLAVQFGIRAFVLERNLAGVTNEESLRPPKPCGNTMNWTVGHVAENILQISASDNRRLDRSTPDADSYEDHSGHRLLLTSAFRNGRFRNVVDELDRWAMTDEFDAAILEEDDDGATSAGCSVWNQGIRA